MTLLKSSTHMQHHPLILATLPPLPPPYFPPTWTKALGSSSALVSREAARALGNLAANLEHGDAILKEGALNIFMALIRSEDHPVQRMAAMALCNLSSNVGGCWPRAIVYEKEDSCLPRA